MKTISVFIFSLLFCVYAFAQNGIMCYTIPSSIMQPGINANYSRMATDSSGKVLICTNGAGMVVFDGNNFLNFSTTNSGIASNDIVDISTTSSKIVIATKNNGLSVLIGNTWTTYDSLNSTLASNQLSRVLAKGNTVYVGSKKNGISILIGTTFTNYSSTNSGLNCDTIYDLALDNSGNLWILTGRGISKFDGTNFTSFTIPGITINYTITSFYCDGNILWFLEPLLFSTKLYKLENNAITNVFKTIDICSDDLYGNYGKTISKGPLGGLLIHTDYGFLEIANNVLYVNTAPITNCFYNSTNAFIFLDERTNLIWNKGQQTQFSSLPLDSFQTKTVIQNKPCRSLDVNNVKTAILNRGDMFWNINDSRYEVPKGSGKHCVFAGALWIGGLDQSRNLHLAAQTYRQSGEDFWPGPLDTLTGSTNNATMQQYDNIWKVDRFQIEQFKYQFQQGNVQNGNFTPSWEILNWPAHGSGAYSRNLAPFVDVNSDGVYNPLIGGDYPLIKGDQMLYWIFNDNLKPHTVTDTLSMKIEIHASAYAYACPQLNDRDSLINYTTFYNYKIFNRSNFNYDSCYLANWTDFQLGNPNDDALGTNAADNFVYVYNLDSSDDGNGINSYGIKPPIMSNVVLNGPFAYLNDSIDNDNDGTFDEFGERNLLTNSLAFHNDFTLQGFPQNGKSFYYYLQSKWKNGASLTYGGNGFGGTSPTRYMYPNFQSDSGGWFNTNASNDVILPASGPFLFPAGSSIDYDFAMVFSRDTTLQYNSPAYYNMAVNDVQKVKSWFDNNNAPSCLPIFPGITEQSNQTNNLLLFPNPSNNSIQIQFNNSSLITELSIYDVMGKCLIASDPKAQAKALVKIEVNKFSPGVYIVSAKDANGTMHHKKFIRE
jgi:hypothetical protein